MVGIHGDAFTTLAEVRDFLSNSTGVDLLDIE